MSLDNVAEYIRLLERAIPVVTDGRFDAATAIAHLLRVEDDRRCESTLYEWSCELPLGHDGDHRFLTRTHHHYWTDRAAEFYNSGRRDA